MTKILISNIPYTKTAFSAKWSEITNRLPPGTTLSGDDLLFVSEAVAKVPSWNSIMLRGTGWFFKAASKKFQGKYVKGIVLVTPNSARNVWIGKGKIVEKIFPKRVAPVVDSEHDRKKVLLALRQVVQPQIDLYRKSINRQLKSSLKYKVRCAITHSTLNYGDFHVDHKYPFKNLVEDWCKLYGFDLEKLAVKCRGTKCRLACTEVAESFFDYHLIHAHLQPTTSKANLSKGSKLL